MNKRILLLGLAALLLSGCGGQTGKEKRCSVVLEECQDVIPDQKSVQVGRGGDVSFRLHPKNGCIVTGTDYEDSEITKENEKLVLTLKNVRYSTVVKLTTSYENCTYFPNGGEGEAVRVPRSKKACNTRTEPFVREGYIQTGWNTKADKSGEHIGFGSRFWGDRLYAEWEKETDASAFSYRCTKESAVVTGYHGEGERCVLPAVLGGKKVRVIQKGAFAQAGFTEFVCSDSVQVIEPGAFENAAVKTLTLFDNLLQISDESFQGCPVKTLYLNAGRAPVYAGSYFSAFPDKCRRLFSRKGKKIVLFSGSSGRYGYDSKRIEEAFPGYEVVNMGVYAYTNARPQLEIILSAMGEGDILVEAPEFDAADWQFCISGELDRFFFSLVETDYRLITLLDLQNYTGVFDALNEYLYEHGRMEAKDYSYLASEYDDEGNRADAPTYNEYGDYTLKRPNSRKDEMHRIIPADYTTKTITEAHIRALDAQLALFTEKKVTVLFTYAPRNRSALTKESTPEQIRATEELLQKTLTVPVISNIEDHFYSGIYFYEIDNHLSDEGVVLRTEGIISDMKQWMEQNNQS